MSSKAGLWIDHREAVIILLTDKGEEVRHVKSNMEKHVRYSGGPSEEAEDMRDRQFGNHLNKYYDEVIAIIRDAEEIQIFGPGEAKGELQARLEKEVPRAGLLELESVDKMTERQIAAKVRKQFLK